MFVEIFVCLSKYSGWLVNSQRKKIIFGLKYFKFEKNTGLPLQYKNVDTFYKLNVKTPVSLTAL